MTETSTTVAATENAARCITGDEAGRRCWREATTQAWDEGLESRRCEEHQRVYDLAQKLDGLQHALEAVGALVGGEAVDNDPTGYLSERAREWRDGVTEDAARTAHKLRVAEFLASRGPEDEGPKNPTMREYGAHLLVRSDALTGAYVAMVDGRELSETERLVILDAMRVAHEEASSEYAAFKEGAGMDRPA